jgi:hypothetical protein
MKTGFTMKTLSLAVLGLAGLGFGASAFAACPTTVAQNESPQGPWTAKTVFQGALSVVDKTTISGDAGLDSSACYLKVQFNSGATGFAGATVRDDTPANESRYRAQFLINADGLTSVNSFAAAQIFSLTSASSFPAANGFNSVVRMTLSGRSGGVNLNILTGCSQAGAPSNNLCTAQVQLPAGVSRVEIDWKSGASGTGYLSYWINKSTADNTPTGTIGSLDNSGWGGIESATLGLSAGNTLFRGSNANQPVKFDTFDSRRSSYIGG